MGVIAGFRRQPTRYLIDNRIVVILFPFEGDQMVASDEFVNQYVDCNFYFRRFAGRHNFDHR